MARAVEQHKAKPAKRTSRRRTSRQSGRGSQNNPSKTEPSPWLSIVDDLFPRWRPRLESSQETASELEALLRSPETRSAFVRSSGDLFILDSEFWRDTAHLAVVPDVDGVGDRLEVRRPTYVHGDGPFSFLPGGTFLVRAVDVERWERLYLPTTTTASALAPSKEPTPLEKYKRYNKRRCFSGGGYRRP